MYVDIEKFQEDIEQLKTKYNEQGPIFTGRNEILLEVCYQLVSRAADFMSITSRKESDVTVRKIKDRIEELEREKIESKAEYQTEKMKLEQKVFELETERNSFVRNEKLFEERIKFSMEDKDKIEKNLNTKWKSKVEEKDQQLKDNELKIKALEVQLRHKEDEGFKKTTEFEKLNALIEQKLQLTENEL